MELIVYLILFRGIGGKTQIQMKVLREKLTKAGFENVATYINSGNAIVRSRMNRKKALSPRRRFVAGSLIRQSDLRADACGVG
jgi:uncharacterized protein (DUF1697 family)